MQTKPVATEIHPTSHHSSWVLDTVPEEELGELSPLEGIQKTPM